jgi:hypothetical protein
VFAVLLRREVLGIPARLGHRVESVLDLGDGLLTHYRTESLRLLRVEAGLLVVEHGVGHSVVHDGRLIDGLIQGDARHILSLQGCAVLL